MQLCSIGIETLCHTVYTCMCSIWTHHVNTIVLVINSVNKFTSTYVILTLLFSEACLFWEVQDQAHVSVSKLVSRKPDSCICDAFAILLPHGLIAQMSRIYPYSEVNWKQIKFYKYQHIDFAEMVTSNFCLTFYVYNIS